MVSLDQLVTPPKKLVVHESKILVTDFKKHDLVVTKSEHILVTKPDHPIVSKSSSSVIKSEKNIKLEKRADKYIIITKNRTYEYRSITWAEKKFKREVFVKQE
jgi:hypothetical protein